MTVEQPARRVISRDLVALMATLGIMAALSCSAPERPADAGASTIRLVDDSGRTVVLDGPVDRVVVANRYNSELIRAMGDIDKVIAVDLNTAQDRPYWPQFDPDESIGKGQSELNLEKILDLRPEALILPRNGRVDEYAAALEPAGIKVVSVTGWDNATLPAQLKILGAVFDNPAGAQQVTDFFTDTIEAIASRTGGATPKKTVYWEYGDPFTTAVPGTSNDGWHNMIVSAGAVNIFGDPRFVGDTVDPERILRDDPDLIVKVTSGGALKNTGRYTPPADGDFAAIGGEMIARPGWSQLAAVRNQNVYMMTGFAGGGLGKAVGSVYLAKWLYPGEMTDVDPDEVFGRWLTLQSAEPITGHTHRVTAVAGA